MKRLSEVDVRAAWRKWARGSGPFRCFFRSTNFVSLRHYPDFALAAPALEPCRLFRAIEELAASGAGEGLPLCLLDLPAVDSMRVAALLQNRHGLKALLTFNSPLHPRGLVGGEAYISALLGYAELLEERSARGYVFVLDRGRFGEYGDDDYRAFFNNQYELVDEDLPSVEMLRALSVDRAVLITAGPPMADAAGYVEYLTQCGFPVIVNNVEEVLPNETRGSRKEQRRED